MSTSKESKWGNSWQDQGLSVSCDFCYGDGMCKMESFLCRAAEEKDLEFISKLSAQVFSEYGNYEEIIPAWFEQGGVITEVIMEKDNTLGFAMLALDRQRVLGSRAAHLLAIGISPEHQRKGIGRALLEHMEDVAQKYGAVEMNLWTAVDNEPALSFFQKAGFEIKRFDSYYYPKGQAALAMNKRLDSR